MQTPYLVYIFSESQLTDPLWPNKTNTSEDYMHNAQSMSCDDMLMICGVKLWGNVRIIMHKEQHVCHK